MVVLRLPDAAGVRLVELAPCTWLLLLHAKSLVLEELLNLPILPLVLHVVVLRQHLNALDVSLVLAKWTPRLVIINKVIDIARLGEVWWKYATFVADTSEHVVAVQLFLLHLELL